MRNRVVLIAEDDADNLEVVRSVIEDLIGLDTLAARNGMEAVQAAAENRPDLILMDLMMPVLSGFEAVRMIRENPETRGIPIIALTALNRPDDRLRASEVGCDDYLDKPFDLDRLTEKVKSLLRD